MKTLLIAAMLLGATITMNAQDEEMELAGSGISHIMGFSYSTVSGAGLTYQHAFDQNYRFKTAGFLFWDESTKDANEDILAFDAGVEFQRTLHQTRSTRLYALTGGQYDYKRTSGGYFSAVVDNKDTDSQIAKTISFGVGVGVEIFAWKNISLSADGNYYFFQTNEENVTPTGPNNSPVFRNDLIRGVRFGFGVGIGYAF